MGGVLEEEVEPVEVVGGVFEELDDELDEELVVGGVDVPGVVEEVPVVLDVEAVVPRVPELLSLVPRVVLEVLPDVVPVVASEVLVVPVVDSEVLEVELVVPRVSGVVPGVVLAELSVVAVVPSVAGVVPELVRTVSVEPVVMTVVAVVPRVPDEVVELPVLVSGPLDEPEVEAEDVLEVLEDRGEVMMHLHALLTLSDLV